MWEWLFRQNELVAAGEEQAIAFAAMLDNQLAPSREQSLAGYGSRLGQLSLFPFRARSRWFWRHPCHS